MAQAQLVTNRIKNRKPVIDVETNSKIRELQRKLVELSFTKGNHTIEYFNTLGHIKKLRNQIFTGTSS